MSSPWNMNSNVALQVPMAVGIEIWSPGMTVCSVLENLLPVSGGHLAQSWRHTPGAHNLNIHHRKNYKSHMRIFITVISHLFSWNSFTSRLVRFKFRFLAAHPVWLYILPTLSSTFRTAPWKLVQTLLISLPCGDMHILFACKAVLAGT